MLLLNEVFLRNRAGVTVLESHPTFAAFFLFYLSLSLSLFFLYRVCDLAWPAVSKMSLNILELS